MSEIVIVLFMFITLLCVISLYRLNSKIAESIRSIAKIIKNKDDAENIKENINKLKETNKELEDEIKMGRVFYDNSKEAIAITDNNGFIISVNNAFVQITGYSYNEVLNKSLMILDSGKSNEQEFNEKLKEAETNEIYTGEVWNRKKTGEIYRDNITLTVIKDEFNDVVNYIAIFRDMTDEIEWKSKLIKEAKTDSLTKLPNRSLFFDRLEQAIKTAERNSTSGALMFIDLDHFKSINDTLGHQVGDLLLIEVAKRLQESVRNADSVSRLSGDEFTIILPDIHEPNDAGLVADNILNKLTKPYYLDGNTINVTCSIGIAIFFHDGNTSESLLFASDQAMYNAKEYGRNKVRFYSAELDKESNEKRSKERQVHEALMNQDFYFEYLPIYKDFSLIEIEPILTLKSNHPLNGLNIIDLTNENSLVVDLTEWMINEIAHKDFELINFNKIKINIPISAIYFKQIYVVDNLKSLFKEEYKKHIRIKINDKVIAKNITEAKIKLRELKDAGFEIVIEDFGQGKISLKDYENLDFDAVEISNTQNINNKIVEIANLFVNDITFKGSLKNDKMDKIKHKSLERVEREKLFEILKKK